MPFIPPRLLAAATVALMAISIPALAETNDDMSFSGMFKLDRLDRNKDRMVSRAEFLDQMGRVWDMKAKEMKAKRDLLTEQELQQVLMYLRAGG
jgi:hypothetical protein